MAQGCNAITVPRRKETACTFKVTKRARDVRIPFEDLIDIMEFALLSGGSKHMSRHQPYEKTQFSFALL